jgi:hypothetical protein
MPPADLTKTPSLTATCVVIGFLSISLGWLLPAGKPVASGN